MRRHPELQPYTTCDRYGIKPVTYRHHPATQIRNNHSIIKQCKTKEVVNGCVPSSGRSNTEVRAKTKINVPAGSGNSNVRNFKTRSGVKQTGPNVVAPTKTNQQTSQKAFRDQNARSMAVSRLPICQASVKPNSKLTLVANCSTKLPSRIASSSRHVNDQALGQDDSGMESSSVDVSSASSDQSETNCRDRPDRRQTGDQERLERTREHFDAMAKKEEEDRQSRLQLVESILSKLNIN